MSSYKGPLSDLSPSDREDIESFRPGYHETPPPCRACGLTVYVACYPDNHALTICTECCPKAEHDDGETGHQFDYHPCEGWTCRYCGIDRAATDWDYGDDG